jgi:hypothetical protein
MNAKCFSQRRTKTQPQTSLMTVWPNGAHFCLRRWSRQILS